MDPLQVYALVEVVKARTDSDSGAPRRRPRIGVASSPLRGRTEKRRPGGRSPRDGHRHPRRPWRVARVG